MSQHRLFGATTICDATYLLHLWPGAQPKLLYIVQAVCL